MSRDSGTSEQSRRRFLQATGTAALTAAVAGCSGDGDGTATQEPADGGDGDGGGGDGDGDGDGGSTPTETEAEETETPTEEELAVSHDQWPYGANETNVDQAKQIMEDAGYGPDNKFDLDWLQYTSPSWKEMANTIRSRLDSAHINMNISEADFGALLEATEKGEHEAFTLGWIADYPNPQNFIQLIDPPNTNYENQDITPNGARLFWSEDAEHGDPDVRQFMVEQFDRIENNPQPTDDAEEIRGDAAVKMEEGMWESCCMIPIYHRFDEFFWYDHVDYDPPGGMGSSRAKASRSVRSLEGKDRLSGTSATFSSLDPVASGNTASGAKIMNMFDAPLNYDNGTTEVVNLLIDDWEANDDVTQYSFTLKEGIQFHDDFGEVTADDMVYSIRRLVESDNSTNTYFPIKVLGIEHEEDEDGNVVPDSTGVEKTGDYSFQITLEEPFAYALSVLAYSAFSVVPEGIVGDIEGYDGEMEYEEFATSNPVGTGPFEFVNWESGNGGEFNADTFEDYHGEGASFDGIDSAIISDPNASHNYFLNKNADVSGIPTSKYDPDKVSVDEELEGGRQVGTYGPLENGETVNYAGVPTINTFYVGFNMQKVPEAVRKAMAYVINHEQFVESVFKGRGEPAFHLQPAQVFPGGAEAYAEHWQG